ncbi:collagen alpha-2(I) chain-like [Macrobrachium rosenbergii]|uniref:collagen alpha-2(I) chain-like n=1 Tax=Macrobrachium rosenbergii TaxID=79674 RepID=UPI0034D48973
MSLREVGGVCPRVVTPSTEPVVRDSQDLVDSRWKGIHVGVHALSSSDSDSGSDESKCKVSKKYVDRASGSKHPVGSSGSSLVGAGGSKYVVESEGSRHVVGSDGSRHVVGSDGSRHVVGSEGSKDLSGSKESIRPVGSEGSIHQVGSAGSKCLVGSKGSKHTVGSRGFNAPVGSDQHIVHAWSSVCAHSPSELAPTSSRHPAPHTTSHSVQDLSLELIQ